MMTAPSAGRPAIEPSSDTERGLNLLRDARHLVDDGQIDGQPDGQQHKATCLAVSQLLQSALPLLKNNPPALLECTQLCERIRDWPTAEKIFARLHELEPEADHQASMAAALYNQRRFQEALNHFDEYSRQKPEAVPAWLNISACLLSLGRLEEAVARLRHWVILKPEDQRVHQALGFSLMQCGEQEEAGQVIQHMLDTFPETPPMRSLAGKHFLRCGDYERGFNYYRSRWARDPDQQPTRGIPCEVWNGKHFTGTLLVAAEGDLGEEILASSMFCDLADMQQHALIECDPRLLSIFRRSFPTLEFVPRGQGRLADAVVRKSSGCANKIFQKIDAGDLGYYFRRDGEFPARQGWLVPDPKIVANMKARYHEQFGDKLRVGIGWQSTQASGHINSSESLDLRAFALILANPEMVGISVQQGDAANDIARLKAELKIDLHVDKTVDARLDIDTLAAQIASLDRVISCNNPVVHLSGALGISCWLMLQQKQPMDWCWAYQGTLCHWYPGIEIFRTDHTLDKRKGTEKLLAGLRGRLDIQYEKSRATKTNSTNHSLSEQRLLATAKEFLVARQPEQARKILQSALSLLNNNPGALLECAQLCQSLHEWKTAEKIFWRIGELRPDSGFEIDLASAFFHRRRFKEALRWYVQHSQNQPDDTAAWMGIGLCLIKLGRQDEAAEQLQRGLGIRPSEPLFDLLARVLIQLGDRGTAEKLLTDAMRHFPDSATLRAVAGQHALRCGDYLRGFDYFRWRWFGHSAIPPAQGIPCETWDGQRFDGTLLVAAEKALGEEILASSMFGDLAAMQQRAIIECDPRLLPIFRRSFPTLDFVSRRHGLLTAACIAGGDKQFRKIDAGDLGYHFRRHGRFPTRNSWLIPDPNKVTVLHERYRQQFGNKLRIGIGWKSLRPVHADFRKNVDLNLLAPILARPDAVGISLQHGDIAGDVARLKADTDIDLYVDPQVNTNLDIDTLAAQIACLDQVVSISNTAVHLAGALGIPCWLLLLRRKQPLMWYWGYEGAHCAWYPAIEIFRTDRTLNNREGAAGVITGLCGKLHTLCAQPSAANAVAEKHAQPEQQILARTRELLAAGQLEDAKKVLKSMPPLRDEYPDTLLECAKLHQDLHEWETAEKLFRHIGKLRSDSGYEAGLAAALFHQWRFQEAVHWYIRRSQNQPDDVDAWMGIGLCLIKLDRYEEAAEQLRRGFSICHHETLVELLVRVQLQLGDRDTTEELIANALRYFPDNKFLRILAGQHYLRCGDYLRGFDCFRERWLDHPEPQPTLTIPCAAWDGQYFNGTLLVAAEEALGEEILVSSMFGDLVAMQQRALIECDPRLLPLFRRSFPALDFVPRGQGELAAACNTSSGQTFRKIDAGDLGYYFRRHGDFPPRKGWLVPDPDKVAALRTRYQEIFANKLRIGIGWKSIRRRQTNFEKNIDLNLLAPVLARPDAVGISLQHGDIVGDIARLKADTGVDLYVDPQVHTTYNLDTLAAQIACLDQVVSISNSAVHLAGALGVPCALLLLQKKQPLMWYWGYEGESCLWYPAIRIFRVDRALSVNAGAGKAVAGILSRLDTLRANTSPPSSI